MALAAGLSILLTHYTAPGERRIALVVWSGSTIVAWIVGSGPSPFDPILSWRWILLAYGILAAVGAVLAYLLLGASRRPGPGRAGTVPARTAPPPTSARFATGLAAVGLLATGPVLDGSTIMIQTDLVLFYGVSSRDIDAGRLAMLAGVISTTILVLVLVRSPKPWSIWVTGAIIQLVALVGLTSTVGGPYLVVILAAVLAVGIACSLGALYCVAGAGLDARHAGVGSGLLIAAFIFGATVLPIAWQSHIDQMPGEDIRRAWSFSQPGVVATVAAVCVVLVIGIALAVTDKRAGRR